NASLITGVASGYYEPMLERNPHLVGRCVTAAMPYGNSEADYRLLQNCRRDPFLFTKDEGLFRFIYAGAMLPRAYSVLERLLDALVILRDNDSEIMDKLRIHFVGTGKSSNDTEGYNIRPLVQRFGLDRWVIEHPSRICYIDVLNHLKSASSTLVL